MRRHVIHTANDRHRLAVRATGSITLPGLEVMSATEPPDSRFGAACRIRRAWNRSIFNPRFFRDDTVDETIAEQDFVAIRELARGAGMITRHRG